MTYRYPSPKYGMLWNRRRWIIFKNMGYICQNCGRYAKGELDLHHITPISCGGNNFWNNLIPLCRKCHSFVHSKGYSGPLLKLRRKR